MMKLVIFWGTIPLKANNMLVLCFKFNMKLCLRLLNFAFVMSHISK